MTAFNLDEYLKRIDYSGPIAPDLRTLTALHRAHVGAIPFENLDIQMGRPILLDAEALQAKMVRQRRGGYCFEQNSLFRLALERIGFDPERREARVRLGDNGTIRPRTHHVLTLSCEGRDWLVDVGFGGEGLLEPLALDGSSSQQVGSTYRVAPEGPLQVLQRESAGHRAGDGDGHGHWEDLYAISPGIVHPIDLEMGNWFTSTYTRSPFVLTLTAQRIIGDTRHVLRNLTYSIVRGGSVEVRDITRQELTPLLRGTLGLDVPEDATFRALDSATDLAALYLRDLTRFVQELQAFPDTNACWKTAPGVTNAAGTLALHLEGNLREFIGRLLGQIAFTRDRPREFGERGVTQAELIARIEAVRDTIPSVLRTLSCEALDAPYPEPLFGKTLSTRMALIHFSGHLNYHLGQIDYLRRFSTGNGAIDLASL
jgi:N-hydroxyarylamine O-acetyltransferase